MDEHKKFYWKKETDNESGAEFIILGYRGNTGEKDLEAWIMPSKGSNLCRFSVDGHHVIDFEPTRLQSTWFLGTPLLYPTPNRVRNGTFKFKGAVFEQFKKGRKILMHGLVHDEMWNYKEPCINNRGITLTTWLDSDENKSFFPSFPFKHQISVSFTLDHEGITISYSILNKDDQCIPIGFALHPYFRKLSGDEGTLISVFSNSIMTCEPEYMPSGEITPIAGTRFDLSHPVPVSERIGIDHEYYPVSTGKSAEIIHTSLNFKLELHASSEFSHMVVYTPANDEYFCLENQTCSINAHNFYAQGFQSHSGLIMVPEGESHTGFVKYLVNKI